MLVISDRTMQLRKSERDTVLSSKQQEVAWKLDLVQEFMVSLGARRICTLTLPTIRLKIGCCLPQQRIAQGLAPSFPVAAQSGHWPTTTSHRVFFCNFSSPESALITNNLITLYYKN
jgi:hypothetical protein